jgi:thiol-disulfide isomerase/thioredoxin
MNMKKIVLLAIGCASAFGAVGAEWVGLDEASYIAGPKITPADLVGKVVLVDKWGLNCPPCRALLPQMQKYWSAFASKGFVLIGSHRQEKKMDELKKLIGDNKLTYPIYQGAGIKNEPPSHSLPFMYVVNHRGQVVYQGRSEREIAEALQEAILARNLPPSLCGDVELKKFKPLANQLMLGKNISAIVKKLEKTAEKSKNAEEASEAKALIAAIEEAKRLINDDIGVLKQSDPEKALQLAALYIKTFPKDETAKELKSAMPELRAAVKEFKAAEKAKSKGKENVK